MLLAAFAALQRYRAHDGARRAGVAVDAGAQELHAAPGHLLVVAAHAANGYGVGEGLFEVVKADDAEILHVEVLGIRDHLQGVPGLYVTEYKQPVEALALELAKLVGKGDLPAPGLSAGEYAGVGNADGPVRLGDPRASQARRKPLMRCSLE